MLVDWCWLYINFTFPTAGVFTIFLLGKITFSEMIIPYSLVEWGIVLLQFIKCFHYCYYYYYSNTHATYLGERAQSWRNRRGHCARLLAPFSTLLRSVGTVSGRTRRLLSLRIISDALESGKNWLSEKSCWTANQKFVNALVCTQARRLWCNCNCGPSWGSSLDIELCRVPTYLMFLIPF